MEFIILNAMFLNVGMMGWIICVQIHAYPKCSTILFVMTAAIHRTAHMIIINVIALQAVLQK
jgi:hypothetical protein